MVKVARHPGGIHRSTTLGASGGLFKPFQSSNIQLDAFLRALAIEFERVIREGAVRNYRELTGAAAR